MNTIMPNDFYIESTIDPFSDTLVAHGFAELLRTVSIHAGISVNQTIYIRDCGAYYQLTTEEVVNEAVVERACSQPWMLIQGIQTEKNAAELESLPSVIDYDAERQTRSDYLDWFKAQPGDRQHQILQGEYFSDAPDSPFEYWDVLRAVNPLSLLGYNKLALNWWTAKEAHIEVIMLLLNLFSTLPNEMEDAVAAWEQLDAAYGWDIKSDVGSLQIFNPGQGKGQNRSKADRLSISNVSGFWLVEYLKVAGFFKGAVTRPLQSGDRKTYVIIPSQVDFEELGQLWERFNFSMLGSETAVRSDILAALRFTSVLLDYAQGNQSTDMYELLMETSRPRNIVRGFSTVFYKNLGNASATMNLSHIALPGWIVVQNWEEIADIKAVLDEHMRVVRQFDEGRGEDLNLLQAYRDFVSGDTIDAFFDFTTGYAGFLIGKRERGQYVIELTVSGLERIFMTTQYHSITQNPGFQEIASAIRHSTVIPQYRKARGERLYDIRYGLHHELSRVARKPEQFVAALGEFITRYNAENAQIAETRNVQYRKNVTTDAIEQILALIDQYGSVVIANLLIAYGYAREERENEAE